MVQRVRRLTMELPVRRRAMLRLVMMRRKRARRACRRRLGRGRDRGYRRTRRGLLRIFGWRSLVLISFLVGCALVGCGILLLGGGIYPEELAVSAILPSVMESFDSDRRWCIALACAYLELSYLLRLCLQLLLHRVFNSRLGTPWLRGS